METTHQSATDRENLAGLIERVTFHNEDSGFCVLRVKARGQRDLVTIVGRAAAIGAGEFVQAGGRWINGRMLNNSIFGTMEGAFEALDRECRRVETTSCQRRCRNPRCLQWRDLQSPESEVSHENPSVDTNYAGRCANSFAR
jgi:hypothetical protein